MLLLISTSKHVHAHAYTLSLLLYGSKGKRNTHLAPQLLEIHHCCCRCRCYALTMIHLPTYAQSPCVLTTPASQTVLFYESVNNLVLSCWQVQLPSWSRGSSTTSSHWSRGSGHDAEITRQLRHLNPHGRD